MGSIDCCCPAPTCIHRIELSLVLSDCTDRANQEIESPTTASSNDRREMRGGRGDGDQARGTVSFPSGPRLFIHVVLLQMTLFMFVEAEEREYGVAIKDLTRM